MSSYFRDNVFETSQTTGTGDFVLGGAVTGARTFASAFSASSSDKIVAYFIRNAVEDGSFESGICLVNGTTLKRSSGAILESSNSNALVNWGAGTKNVWCGPPALLSDRLNDNIECGTAGGTANAITLSPNVPVPELRAGMTLSWTASATNTGAVTVNPSSLGATALYKPGTSGPTALTGGEIQSGQSVKARYDGTQFQMMTPTGVGAAAAGQIPGTATNDDASSGNVGQVVSSTVLVGSPVSLTSGQSANITSISLGAGDWEVDAMVGFSGNSSTAVTYIQGSISQTAGTVDSTPGSIVAHPYAGATIFANTQPHHAIAPLRIKLASTTTIYLVANAGFSVSTCNAFGIIKARRVR